MNDVKTTFYKTLNIIVGTNRVDNEEAYIINDYISRLEATIKDEQQEIDRLNNIINELESYLEQQWLEWKNDSNDEIVAMANEDKAVLDKLKELKEGNK